MTWDPDDIEIDLSGFDQTGGRPQPHDLKEIYSPDTLWKAKELLEETEDNPTDGPVQQDPEQPDTWYVQGSHLYVVRDTQVVGLDIPWLTCTCPNGDARGGRPNCYHTAAVAALILGQDLSGIERPRKGGRK